MRLIKSMVFGHRHIHSSVHLGACDQLLRHHARRSHLYHTRIRKERVQWDNRSWVSIGGYWKRSALHNNDLSAMMEKQLERSNWMRRGWSAISPWSMQKGTTKEKVSAMQKIDRSTGSILFPYLVKYTNDPAWQWGRVLRTCSFLRYAQGCLTFANYPAISNGPCASNAVRALGNWANWAKKVCWYSERGWQLRQRAAQSFWNIRLSLKENVRGFFRMIKVRSNVAWLFWKIWRNSENQNSLTSCWTVSGRERKRDSYFSRWMSWPPYNFLNSSFLINFKKEFNHLRIKLNVFLLFNISSVFFAFHALR